MVIAKGDVRTLRPDPLVTVTTTGFSFGTDAVSACPIAVDAETIDNIKAADVPEITSCDHRPK
jgi:hypothetical protein